MKTWNEFTDSVTTLLTVDGRRVGMEAVMQAWMRQAVIDLQTFIPEFRKGHKTTYLATDDLTTNGFCVTGILPDQAELQEAYISKVDYSTARVSVHACDWNQRHDLKAGNVPSQRNLITINPKGGEFWLYPVPDDTHQLELFWDGVKIDFDTDDEVPFPEDAEQAVADWVTAQIERKVNKDLAAHKSYIDSYEKKRTQLFLNAKARTRMKSVESSPMPELTLEDPPED